MTVLKPGAGATLARLRAEAECERGYMNLRIAHAKKGNERSYLTGLLDGKRRLICEITAKQHSNHNALVQHIRDEVLSRNMSKTEALALRWQLVSGTD